MIRLSASLHAGELTAATAAVARAEAMLNQVPGRPRAAGYPDLSRRVQVGRAAVDLWSGRPEEAAEVLQAGLAGAVSSGREAERADWAGPLALAEALVWPAVPRCGAGQPGDPWARGATAAGRPRPAAAPLVALAWVHLKRGELPQARSFLKQADAALGQRPDKLIGAVAYLVAAGGALAEGRSQLAVQVVAKARSGLARPGVGARPAAEPAGVACVDGGGQCPRRGGGRRTRQAPRRRLGSRSARPGGRRGQRGGGARARVRPQQGRGRPAGTGPAGRRPGRRQAPYTGGDVAGGRHALACALRLAEREQLRLPLMLERGWLEPVVRRDPRLAETHRRLLAPIFGYDQIPAPAAPRDEGPVLVVEPLTERELEVLTHVSSMLNTAEVAREMYISVNTVKTHLRNIYRKLAAAHRNEAGVRRARQLQLI